MTELSDPKTSRSAALSHNEAGQSLRIVLLVCFHLTVCAVSLRIAFPYYRAEYILYEPTLLYGAIASTAILALAIPLFAFARTSFGYFCGFYLFTVVAGYLWINTYSKFQYNHVLAGASAIASCVMLLLPALFITSPIGRPGGLSTRTFELLLSLIVLLSFATSVIAATYGFRLVALGQIYEYRAQLQFPSVLNYAIAAVNTVLLPFAFACYALRRKYWMAIVVLAISVSFYPSTFTKLALFAPTWLIFITLLSRFSERMTPILSLCLPILAGIVLITAIGTPTRLYFSIVNSRMVIVPSQAMDIYNEYFARHELTHFCQIWFIKPFVPCALQVPLAVEMQNTYVLGNFNASLFATEGIASIGLWGAPIAALVCGLIIALGNRLSAGLSARFILISAAIVPQTMINIPFSTMILTHGLWILFLLWYLTPRNLFGETASSI